MERGISRRRLISLICAGWVPHDNLFIGDSASLVTWIEPKSAIKFRRAYPFIVSIPLPVAPLSIFPDILNLQSRPVVMLGHHAPHEPCEFPRNRRRSRLRVFPRAHEACVFGLEPPKRPVRVVDNNFAVPGPPRLQRGAW